MFKRSKVCTGVLVAIGGALAAGSLPSFAQDTQRIEITGSLIRRIQGETALPTVQLKADDLQRAGATNAENIVQFITQQQGGSVTTGSVSGTNGAASYANLRSLGSNRTLVLLNGRRVVNNPYASSAVDLNTLPMVALERIDTLPDGASAVYGTDAIAGVINFVTRRSFKGFAVEGLAQVPEEGGGEVYSASAMAGFGDVGSQRFNVYFGISAREQKPMLGTEREFMRTSYIPSRGFNGLSPTTFPANYTQGAVTGNPSLADGCLPSTSIAVPEANGTTIRCFADTQAFTQVVPIQKQVGIFAKATYALNDDNSLNFEYFKTRNQVSSQIAPSPETGLTMTPLSPFYPTANTPTGFNPTANISVNWRTTVLGPRRGEQTNDTQRAVLSLEGAAMNWDYSASLLYTDAEVTNDFLQGYPMTNAIRRGVEGCAVALVNNVCPAGQQLTFNGQPVYLNPFGAQTEAGLAYFQANQVLGRVQDGQGSVQGVQLSGSRSIFSLPAGAVTIGLAAEFRKEDMRYFTDVPKVSQAASSGLAGSGALREGDRDVEALGMEVNVPIVKNLEGTLSVRTDNYSDFGRSTNPKFSLKWTPTSSVLLRGSINKGFSAPALTDLYFPNSTTFTGNRYNDPLLCPGGVVNAGAGGIATRDCGIQFQRLTGGNTELKPERSKAWTVGIVLEPVPSVSLTLDYWKYHIKDSISTIGDASIFADPAKYAALYVRCSQAPEERRAALGACQNVGSADPLAYVLDTNQNLGDTRTSGVDVSATWRSGATPYGRFSVSANGSYTAKYEFQVEPGGTWYSPVGRWASQFVTAGTSGGQVFRYQTVTSLGWDASAWSSRLMYRVKSGYRDQNSQGAPYNVAPFNTNDVPNFEVFDLSVQYRGIRGLTLGLGVLNLADQDPPFSNQTARFQARGYDDRYASALGRTWQASARYEF